MSDAQWMMIVGLVAGVAQYVSLCVLRLNQTRGKK